MRTLTVAEGTGTVIVHRGRADVKDRHGYVGRLVRLSNGRWRDLARPHLSFRGPAEGAEDMIEQQALAAVA
jgi:hypothetical protein